MTVFCYCDLDHNPVTLIYKLDVGIAEINLHTKKWTFQVKAFRS